MRYCITFLLLLLLISPALTVQFSAGENLKITDEKPLNDDFMLAGNTVKIEQEINGDLFIAAKTAVVDRVVRGSLHIAAGTITLRAPINGSLYIAGGNVTVDAPVGRNVVVAGGKVIIGPAANIARDLAIAGGEITVAGLINRDVIANGGTLKIARTAIIGRNLRAKVESAQIDAAARVSGQKNIVITPTQKMKKNKFSPVAYMMMVLFCSICLLVAGLFLVGLSPKFTSEVVSTLQTRPWVSLLLGLILVVIAPLIFIILLFLLPLAFIFLSLELMILYLAPIFVAILLGKLLLRVRVTGRYAALLLGIGLLFLVQLIPGLGTLIMIVAALLGTGALLLTLFTRGAAASDENKEMLPAEIISASI